MFRTLVAVALSLLVFVGCSKAGNSSLAGNWTSGCAGFSGDQPQASDKFTMTLGSSGSLTVTEQQFSDTSCNQPVLNIQITGTYSANGNILALNPTGSPTVTLLTSQAVTNANNEQYLGLSNWQLNSPVTINASQLTSAMLQPSDSLVLSNGNIPYSLSQGTLSLNNSIGFFPQ